MIKRFPAIRHRFNTGIPSLPFATAVFSLLVLFSVAFPVAAQPNTTAILTGRVTDAASGEPLVGAHVFIASSMIGTTTDADGGYRLERVPTGAHRLYVSILGFESDFLDVMLRTSRVYEFDFELDEAVIEVGEVVVEGEEDEDWQRRLERFTRLFIGETPNSLETEILNPEVLDFEEGLGSLRAIASAPLVIENRALGYRIQYFLEDFKAEGFRTQYDGEPLFEEMDPSSPEQAARWEAKRREAFMGSFRHFLLALIADRVEAQGFKTWSRPGLSMAGSGMIGRRQMLDQQRFPVEPGELISATEHPGEYELDFRGFVEIRYLGETEGRAYLEWAERPGRGDSNYQTSWINLENGPTIVDYKGDTLDPYGVTLYGYLAFERVANEVPKEYRPGR